MSEKPSNWDRAYREISMAVEDAGWVLNPVDGLMYLEGDNPLDPKQPGLEPHELSETIHWPKNAICAWAEQSLREMRKDMEGF